MTMKNLMHDELLQLLKKQTDAASIQSPSGGAVVCEFGARLLGLFPSTSLPNILWTNSSLSEVITACSWQIGGERLWVAPERHFFYENPRDFDGFHVPAGLDPGTYSRTGDATFQNVFSLLDLARNEVYDNTVATRSFSAIHDPYGTGLPFTGVSIADSITVPSSNAVFCAWSLAQVATCGPGHPGTALFAVRKGGTFCSYFDPVPPSRGEPGNGYVRFRIDAGGVFKIGIAPEDIRFENPCKAVYVSPFPKSEMWFAVLKRTDHLPRTQAECLDVPKCDPDGKKGAVQSYNSGPNKPDEAPLFGEIELQLPPARKSGKKTISAATHELLGYAGSKGQILELARTALEIKDTPAVY